MLSILFLFMFVICKYVQQRLCTHVLMLGRINLLEAQSSCMLTKLNNCTLYYLNKYKG